MMVSDFHSHVLPGIDDGSGTVEESMAMLRMEAEQGISRVIATPHFYAHHDRPERFLERRKAAAELLHRHMEGQTGLPMVELGAEVYFFQGMSECDALSQLTIGQNRSILIEMPPAPWTRSMYRELEQIWTRQRLIPVLAHLDRYIAPLRSGSVLRQLEELPLMVQANGDFFLRRSTMAFAVKLLRQNRIHVLGSDCHNTGRRPPNLGAALDVIRSRCGEGILDRIRDNEREILWNSFNAVEIDQEV